MIFYISTSLLTLFIFAFFILVVFRGNESYQIHRVNTNPPPKTPHPIERQKSKYYLQGNKMIQDRKKLSKDMATKQYTNILRANPKEIPIEEYKQDIEKAYLCGQLASLEDVIDSYMKDKSMTSSELAGFIAIAIATHWKEFKGTVNVPGLRSHDVVDISKSLGLIEDEEE